ncbi:MAG: MFS transporter, partial [Burkholderiales bacterium]|nr:MFS transporter [Burkholderiales bacterium]
PSFFDQWLVLIVACLGGFVVGTNATGVMTALPAIKVDLDLTTLAQEWVMNIYMICASVLVAIMGRLSDIFGKLSVFMFGL